MLKIPLKAGIKNSHQRFTVQLGNNSCYFKVDYFNEYKMWTVNVSSKNIGYVNSARLSAGAEISATHSQELGRFFFVGKEATLENLGQDNSLVWSESE